MAIMGLTGDQFRTCIPLFKKAVGRYFGTECHSEIAVQLLENLDSLSDGFRIQARLGGMKGTTLIPIGSGSYLFKTEHPDDITDWVWDRARSVDIIVYAAAGSNGARDALRSITISTRPDGDDTKILMFLDPDSFGSRLEPMMVPDEKSRFNASFLSARTKLAPPQSLENRSSYRPSHTRRVSRY